MQKRFSMFSVSLPLLILGLTVLFAARQAGGAEAVFEFGKQGPLMTEWLVAQPFPDDLKKVIEPGKSPMRKYDVDLLTSIGGEEKARPKAGDTVTYQGKTLVFKAVSDKSGAPSLFKLVEGAGTEQVPAYYVAYGYCTVHSEKQGKAFLHVGTPGSLRVWLNGKLLYPFDSKMTLKKEAKVFQVELNAGNNSLLVKRAMKRNRGDLYLRLATPAENRTIQMKDASETLTVTAAESAQGAPAKIRVALDPPSDSFNDVRSVVEAVDLEGKVVASTSVSLGVDSEFALPQGLFRLRARVDDFGGRKLHGEGDCVAGTDGRAALAEIAARARKAQRERDLGDYAGWVELEAAKVEERLREDKGASALAKRFAFDLAANLEKAAREPSVLKTLRGLHEWAYVSKADGTGQPFAIWIPEDYEPGRAYPLEILLHGSASTHLFPHEELGIGSKFFHVRALGRGTSLGYEGLGEIDVLELCDFVRSHWNIDPLRIHLYGISMGGGGTFALASRHPDLFASARPICGWGLGEPVGNMLNLPVYSIHSDDDAMVSIAGSRGPLDRLARLGGKVVKSETTWYGHGVIKWKEGCVAQNEWALKQAQRESVRRVRYTATDEVARGAYWVEVAEWGPEGRPATIDVRLGDDNTLYADLDNVSVARIDLAASPANQRAAMQVVVNSRVITTIKAPLPPALYIAAKEGGWSVGADKPAAPAQRLHFPGGAMALYHGEPLLVVWGTQADEATNRRIYEVAQIARRSSNPRWPKAEDSKDGVPSSYMIYGRLPGKPDREVTAEDMKTHNLLLIGTAAQNSVVERLADKLPVKIEGSRVVASDGMSWNFAGRALGLLHYNPQAPQRLIYWAASSASEFYAAGTPLMDSQSWSSAPPDFMVTDAKRNQVVAARRFDSHWRFESGYVQTPFLPKSMTTRSACANLSARAAMHVSGADFAIVSEYPKQMIPFLAPGEARIADAATLEYNGLLCMEDISGEEILRQAAFLRDHEVDGNRSRFVPAPDSAKIEPKRSYRVALPETWPYIELIVPSSYTFRETDITLREMILRGM